MFYLAFPNSYTHMTICESWIAFGYQLANGARNSWAKGWGLGLAMQVKARCWGQKEIPENSRGAKTGVRLWWVCLYNDRGIKRKEQEMPSPAWKLLQLLMPGQSWLLRSVQANWIWEPPSKSPATWVGFMEITEIWWLVAGVEFREWTYYGHIPIKVE